jgi:hypothetical protein
MLVLSLVTTAWRVLRLRMEETDSRYGGLVGSLVTTAWRVLRLRMEETASRYGGLVGSLVTTAWRVLGCGWWRRPPEMKGSCEYIE